ncbi:MAG: hypothetical protein GY787_18175 [Alteromonadales bacterium]|nr:hypothetical protein [Alteromonadales bacterium]
MSVATAAAASAFQNDASNNSTIGMPSAAQQIAVGGIGALQGGVFSQMIAKARGKKEAKRAAAERAKAMPKNINKLDKRVTSLENEIRGGGGGESSNAAVSTVSGSVADSIGVSGGSEIAASNVTPDDNSVDIEAPVTFSAPAQQAAGDMYGNNFARMAAVGAAKMIKNKKI